MHHVSTGNGIQALYKSNKCSQAEPAFSSPSHIALAKFILKYFVFGLFFAFLSVADLGFIKPSSDYWVKCCCQRYFMECRHICTKENPVFFLKVDTRRKLTTSLVIRA